MKIAIENNDLPALKSELSRGVHIDCYLYISEIDVACTPLQYASFLGKDTIVSFLIQQGASLDARTREQNSFLQNVGYYLSLTLWSREGGFTALHLASRSRRTECVKLLLAGGVDYRIKDRRCKLPLTVSELCQHFADNQQLTDIDLSIYGIWKKEYLEPLKQALMTGKIQVLKLTLPDVSLNCTQSTLELFLNTVNSLKLGKHLSSIQLEIKYIIDTGGLGVISQFETEQVRDNMKIVFEKLLELSQSTPIKSIHFGTIIHQHTVHSLRSTTDFQGRTTTITEIESSTKIILSIDDDTITSIAANPKKAMEELNAKNLSISGKCDVFTVLFNSSALNNKKFLDSEHIVDCCSKIQKISRPAGCLVM